MTLVGSTTPANGDENPYAIWPVTETVGSVRSGDVLVDNFNNKSGDQGTGTTIVDVHPDGQTTVFEIDRGDVVRLSLSESTSKAPTVTAETQVASGFAERPDAAAFVRGPTGLVLGANGALYVADNLGNRIVSIPEALTRSGPGPATTVTSGGQLANPLGLAVTPNGDLLAANATNGKIVEITPTGKQVGEYYADQDVGQDPPGNGDLFDVAINQAGSGVLFVNDGTNTLELLH